MKHKPVGTFLLSPDSYELIYGPAERAEVATLINLVDVAEPAGRRLGEVEVILSGWGCPPMDAAFLAQAPKLQAVFYGAGSVRGITSDEFWARGLRITSAWGINAIPVAEFTVAALLLSLKQAWFHMFATKQAGRFPARRAVAGAYGSTVGLISLGRIGRLVSERLQSYDVRVIAYDPFCPAADAAALGVELRPLADVFREADVVSLHTPWLKETEGMITATHFGAMKPGATFLNTARGAVVCEPDLIAVAQQRPDLTFLLDVTHPEPPVPGSPLYSLPNVLLTPHIAGSVGPECQRMGRFMVDELRRFLAGEPLLGEITQEKAALLA